MMPMWLYFASTEFHILNPSTKIHACNAHEINMGYMRHALHVNYRYAQVGATFANKCIGSLGLKIVVFNLVTVISTEVQHAYQC